MRPISFRNNKLPIGIVIVCCASLLGLVASCSDDPTGTACDCDNPSGQGQIDPAGDADEFYWANDLEDFLDGKLDEFSIFPRKPLAGKALRLWKCLGMPFLNQDLVKKKLRMHFERAAAGLANESWVLPFYEGVRGIERTGKIESGDAGSDSGAPAG